MRVLYNMSTYSKESRDYILHLLKTKGYKPVGSATKNSILEKGSHLRFNTSGKTYDAIGKKYLEHYDGLCELEIDSYNDFTSILETGGVSKSFYLNKNKFLELL